MSAVDAEVSSDNTSRPRPTSSTWPTRRPPASVPPADRSTSPAPVPRPRSHNRDRPSTTANPVDFRRRRHVTHTLPVRRRPGRGRRRRNRRTAALTSRPVVTPTAPKKSGGAEDSRKAVDRWSRHSRSAPSRRRLDRVPPAERRGDWATLASSAEVMYR